MKGIEYIFSKLDSFSSAIATAISGSKRQDSSDKIGQNVLLNIPGVKYLNYKGRSLPIPSGAASDPYLAIAGEVFTGTIGSTDVTAGAVVYFDGTDWELADASLHTTFGEAVATHAYAAGEVGTFCTSGILVDIDAPYTQGASYYLSETAGELTATIPTTNAAIRQVVGFALSTSQVRLNVLNPRLSEQFFAPAAKDGTAEPGLGVITDGWAGPGVDAAAETVYVVGRFPLNFTELEQARMVTSSSAGSAVDYDFSHPC